MVAEGRTSRISENEVDDKPRFDDLKEEASYWKSIADDYRQKLKDTKEEFEEFQEGSRELEAELETQLQQYEVKSADLMNAKEKLKYENEVLREKLETSEKQANEQITDLQDENTQLKTIRDEMSKYIRELEQSNDDLERTKRATISSLEEFDVRLSNAIERNVLLENELEEKEELIITVQRLKDESRDLKEELAANMQGKNTSLQESKLRLEGVHTQNMKTNTVNAKCNENIKQTRPSHVNGTRTTNNNEKNNGNSSSEVKVKKTFSENVGSASTRISALNIVADILQKVAAMETKLAHYRTLVQDSSRTKKIC